MKKILIAIILIAAIGGYAFWSSTKSGATAVPVTTTTDANNTPTPTSAGSETTNPNAVGTNTGTNSGNTTPPTGSTKPAPAPSGAYKDGTYTGKVADAVYGNMQVKATVSGGKLTNVTFLQYPNDQHESQEINSRSNPQLKSEAIAAQSAKVNIVSGATQSSQAFQESLADALVQAHA